MYTQKLPGVTTSGNLPPRSEQAFFFFCDRHHSTGTGMPCPCARVTRESRLPSRLQAPEPRPEEVQVFQQSAPKILSKGAELQWKGAPRKRELRRQLKAKERRHR